MACIRHIKNSNRALHFLFTFHIQDLSEIVSVGEKVGLSCAKDALNGAVTGACPLLPSSFLLEANGKANGTWEQTEVALSWVPC